MNSFKNTLKKFLRHNLITEFRFFILLKYLSKHNCKILDIGCGKTSIYRTKIHFPKCHYYGLDISRKFYTSKDFELMDEFYEINLNSGDYSKIPNNYFDLLIFSHVIEHLPEGEKVIIKLLPKIKKNGLIYIEYPSIRSTKLPHMKGTLNFYDDPTHIRLYSPDILFSILRKRGFEILKKGIRRDYRKIIFLPLIVLYDLIKYRYIKAGHLWDLFGFADYLIALKIN